MRLELLGCLILALRRVVEIIRILTCTQNKPVIEFEIVWLLKSHSFLCKVVYIIWESISFMFLEVTYRVDSLIHKSPVRSYIYN